MSLLDIKKLKWWSHAQEDPRSNPAGNNFFAAGKFHIITKKLYCHFLFQLLGIDERRKTYVVLDYGQHD